MSAAAHRAGIFRACGRRFLHSHLRDRLRSVVHAVPPAIERRPRESEHPPQPPEQWAQFQVGPLTIHAYALCIIAGIIAATLILGRRLKRRGIEPGVRDRHRPLVGAPRDRVRAFYHVFTHVADYFAPGGDNLWNVFAIWDGGNALYGSLIGGGTVGIAIACRRARVRFWSLADASRLRCWSPSLSVDSATTSTTSSSGCRPRCLGGP